MAVIHIQTLQQLQDMKNDLTADYILDNNIDASATSGWNAGAGFEPIGTWATDIGNRDIVYHCSRDNFPTGPQSATYSFEHNPAFAIPQRGPLVVIQKGATAASKVVRINANMQVVS